MAKLKRVITVLPESEHAKLKAKAAESGESMQWIGAQLFRKWLIGKIVLPGDMKIKLPEK